MDTERNWLLMRMNTVVLAALALIPLLPFAAKAEDAPKVSDSEKIDSILVMQKQVVRTIKNDPLTGKNFGVELNIARLLLAKEVMSVSGGFSLFNVDRDAEIAFPFYYGKSEANDFEAGFGDIDFTEITQDIHYRYFLGNTQNGFYLSGFARGAYLDGVLGDYVFDNLGDSTGTPVTRAIRRPNWAWAWAWDTGSSPIRAFTGGPASTWAAT